jgi:hypothetical protein
MELGQKATDPDYLEYQRTISANIKAGARIRHEIMLRKLLWRRGRSFWRGPSTFPSNTGQHSKSLGVGLERHPLATPYDAD